MDNRKPWTYRGCRVVPCTGEPRYFGVPKWKEGSTQYRTRWWKVRFLDGPRYSWSLCGTKAECRTYIDRKYTYGTPKP